MIQSRMLGLIREHPHQTTAWYARELGITPLQARCALKRLKFGFAIVLTRKWRRSTWAPKVVHSGAWTRDQLIDNMAGW